MIMVIMIIEIVILRRGEGSSSLEVSQCSVTTMEARQGRLEVDIIMIMASRFDHFDLICEI